jgi:hypothetical protein
MGMRSEGILCAPRAVGFESDKGASSRFGPSSTMVPMTGQALESCFSRLVNCEHTRSFIDNGGAVRPVRLGAVRRFRRQLSMTAPRPNFSTYAKRQASLR